MFSEFVLTAITDHPGLVQVLDAARVDRIGLDIERIGKSARQGHVEGARISEHRLEDLATVAANVRNADVFIRVNPIHAGSRFEIDRAIELGAAVVMLPYFTEARAVAQFVDLIGGRARPVLLLETAAAAARVREIVEVPGVAEVMVGLNDLHMSLGLVSPFEVVVSDLMETIARRVLDAGLRFGFGGLARPDDSALPVPPDLVYPQYARLGATSAWLARSFFRSGNATSEVPAEVARLRERLSSGRSSRPRPWIENEPSCTPSFAGWPRRKRGERPLFTPPDGLPDREGSPGSSAAREGVPPSVSRKASRGTPLAAASEYGLPG